MTSRWDGKFPLLTRLSAEIGKPIAFIDLETTSAKTSVPHFGVAEIAYIAIMPDGKTVEFSSLANPEFPMEPMAAEITGLNDEMLANQPTYSHFHPRIKALLERSVVSGYNVREYDIPGLFTLMERRGLPKPEKVDVLDVRDLWAKASNQSGPFVKGKLTEVAEKFGCAFEGAHEALADVAGAAAIMEEMLWRYGKEWSLASMSVPGRKASQTGGAPMPGEELSPREAELKDLIDGFLSRVDAGGAKGQAALSAELAVAGWTINVSTYGASFTKAGEKVAGSRLGKGYGWKDLSLKISGSAAQSQTGAPSATPPTGSNQTAAPGGGTEKDAIKEAILDFAKTTAPIDVKDVARSVGLSKFTGVSITLGEMLQAGEIGPEHVIVSEAQTWLQKNWNGVKDPSDARLKPMLERAKALGAPDSVDYVQLRAALLIEKNGFPSPMAGAEKKERSTFPRPAPQGSSPAEQSAGTAEKLVPHGSTSAAPRESKEKPMGVAERAAAAELEWLEHDDGPALQEGVDYVELGDPTVERETHAEDAGFHEEDFPGFWGEEDGLDEPTQTSSTGFRPKF